jgi:hypothetical protein
MTPDTYQRCRDELIDLLSEAVALESVNEDTRSLLQGVRRKTLEDQFEIVLAGEFQGGKSTTFNALCDGRELSPVGAGIKTSGCILSAQNLADPQAPESAEIEWRTPRELAAGFSDLLLPHLQNLAPARFECATAAELPDLLDLDSVADRDLTARAVDAEWAVWKRNRSGYDPEQKGLLDVLRIASLIARFHAHEELIRLREKRRFSPEEVRGLAAFPPDWEERWLDRDPDRFRADEVVFVFIARIRLKLHSPNLGRLGCVLTDCPGLFASRWDTEVARRAMFNADAVLYLFDGSKTLKLSDLNALQFIQKNGMGHKLFFGCNMRAHTLADSRRILNASISALSHHGFDIQDREVTLFHALLGLRTVQAMARMNGASAAVRPDIEEDRLRKTIRRQVALLDPQGPEDEEIDADLREETWNPDILARVRRLSGIDRLLDMVAETVVRKRARAILIDNGARMAAGSLLEAEGALRSREHGAFQKEREFRRQVAETETALRKFKGDCVRILDRIEETGPDYVLADDIWTRLADRQPGLIQKIGDRIYSEVIGKMSLSLLVRERFKDKITAIIKAEIDACFTETINGWVSEIRDGGNLLYRRHLVKRVQGISRDLKQVWDASDLSEMAFLQGIGLPEFSGDLALDTAAILRELDRDHALENVRYNALLAAGGMTGIFTATSGLLVAVYMLITRLFWIRIATVVVFLVNIILVLLTRGMIEKSLRGEIQRKLTPAIEMLFMEIQEDVKAEFRGFVGNIRSLYAEVFRAAVNKPEKVFAVRKDQAERDFQSSREVRLAVAETARRVRETRIRPLRVRLQGFTARVEAGLPEFDSSEKGLENRS